MKFELKTQNDEFQKSFISLSLTFFIIYLVVILSYIAIKFGKITTHYELNYLCRLLIVEKSSYNFKQLSKLTNQTSKQKMWDLCNEIIK